jgi:hypothetical protein
MRDYCPPYSDPDVAEQLCRQINGSLLSAPHFDVAGLLDALDHGLERLLSDCEQQELVRRAVLPAWSVMQRKFAE